MAGVSGEGACVAPDLAAVLYDGLGEEALVPVVPVFTVCEWISEVSRMGDSEVATGIVCVDLFQIEVLDLNSTKAMVESSVVWCLNVVGRMDGQ